MMSKKPKNYYEQFMPNVFEDDITELDLDLNLEDTLVMCPHCGGTDNELRNGEWYCINCSCLHKYLKPRK